MRILIYKRTHKGDPDETGIFGIQDCMGRIRNWNYDAVIGIGGKSAWKGEEGIKHKINWIGLEPKRIKSKKRGDCVVFSHFELFEESGKNIKDSFPKLFNYMYSSRKRFDMSNDLPEDVYLEVEQILKSVLESPPSQKYRIENIDDLEGETLIHSANCSGCIGEKNIEIIIGDKDLC